MEIKKNSRWLAIDLGEKRIGVAVSDFDHQIARPLQIFRRRSRKEDFAHIQQLVTEQHISLIVMGLPIPLNGIEGDRAAWVRNYSAGLVEVVPIELVFWDESMSTQKALELRRMQGKGRKKRREHVDAVAAAFILQEYMDQSMVNR